MSYNRPSRRTGHLRTAVALGTAAATLVVGAGLASAADAAPSATKAPKPTVKAKTAKPHAHTKAFFTLGGKYSVGAKSSWSVDFGDKWQVQSTKAKTARPASVWHSYATTGKKLVRYTVTDAKGVKHTTTTTIAVTATAGTVPAGVTAAVGYSLNKTFAVSHNGKIVSVIGGITVDGSAIVSVDVSVSVPGTPVSANPTPTATSHPTVTPGATPTASPTVMPTATATPTVTPTGTPTPSVTPTATPTVTPTATPTASPTTPAVVVPAITSTSIAGLQLGGGNITTVDIFGTGFQAGAVLVTPQVTTCNVLLVCAVNPFGYTSSGGVVGQMTRVSSTDLRIVITVPNSLLGGVSYALTVRNPDGGTSALFTQSVASIL
jgi:hypothetical protein